MNVERVVVALAGVVVSGLSWALTLDADASAILLEDQRYVRIVAPLVDSAGDVTYRDEQVHDGLGGGFEAALLATPGSPGGSVAASGSARQTSVVTVDGAGRLRGFDLEVDTSAIVEELGPDAAAGGSIDALSGVRLVFDILSPTHVTWSGHVLWDGMLSLTGPGTAITDGPVFDTETVALDPGRYTLVFEASAKGRYHDLESEEGRLTATFSMPEPGTGVMVGLGGVGALSRKRRRGG